MHPLVLPTGHPLQRAHGGWEIRQQKIPSTSALKSRSLKLGLRRYAENLICRFRSLPPLWLRSTLLLLDLLRRGILLDM